MNNELIEAAKSVIARWDSPLWKHAEPTAEVMNRLRNALAALSEQYPPIGTLYGIGTGRSTATQARAPAKPDDVCRKPQGVNRLAHREYEKFSNAQWVKSEPAKPEPLPEVESFERWFTANVFQGEYLHDDSRLMFLAEDVRTHFDQLTATHKAELANLSHELFRQREEELRLVGVIARKNGAEELAEAKGRREALQSVPVEALANIMPVLAYSTHPMAHGSYRALSDFLAKVHAAQAEHNNGDKI